MDKNNEIIIKLKENEYEYLLFMINDISARKFKEGTPFSDWERQLINKIFEFENKDNVVLSDTIKDYLDKFKRKVEARNILLD